MWQCSDTGAFVGQNSDMDYRIFNVRTLLFLCVRVHGVGHTDSKSAQRFWLGKTLTNVCCASDTGRVRTSDLGSDTLPTVLPRLPRVGAMLMARLVILNKFSDLGALLSDFGHI